MFSHSRSKTLAFLALSSACVSFNAWVSASTGLASDDADYVESLKIVQAKIERERTIEKSNASGALSSTLLFRLMGRYYEVGDQWDVAAFLVDHPNHAPNAGHGRGASRSEGVRKGGVFRYRVAEINRSPQPSVVIEVRQLSAHGLKPVDSKVEKLTLKMNDQMLQSEKAYSLAGRVAPVRVAPSGVRSQLTELELFPLDVPELLTAIAEKPTRLPKLPAAAERVLSQAGASLALREATWFEQDDFFGRPIQALWERGKPWPSYFRTSTGIAVLLTR
jgi:hypothetical protein